MAADRRRDHAQVGDVDAGRRDPGDHRALDHPAARRGASRLATTRAPRFSAVPSAAASRTADVGGQVDVDHPRDALLAEEPARRARLPDQALVELRAGLDLLERVDPDAGHDHALGAERDLVADRDALVDAHVRAQVAAAAEDRALDVARCGRCTSTRRRSSATTAAALAHRDARREHRVRPHARVRGRSGSSCRRRPAPRSPRGRRGRTPSPSQTLPRMRIPGISSATLLVERVEVRLPVLVEVADVLPVAVEHAAVDRPAHLEQQREELLREVVRPVGRHVLQHLRLEHVDAGVDRVGEDLAPGRLLEEALDAALLVGDDDPELERVLDRLEADRDRRLLLAVELDEPRQVDVAERVAGDDEEGVVEPAGGEPHRAGGAERRLLDRVRRCRARATRRCRSSSRIACGRNATVTITSSKPCRASSSMMCSMHGLPTIGTIGFGWFEVSGRRRVPSPPAMTTAFIAAPPSRARAHVEQRRDAAPARPGPEEVERPARRRRA